MSQAYTISCRRCSQAMTVLPEAAGTSGQCPACGLQFALPTQSRAAKIWSTVPEQVREFAAPELAELTALDAALPERLRGATNRNCWEHALAAELLERALAPLTAYLGGDVPGPVTSGGAFGKRGRAYAFLNAAIAEFLQVQENLCTAMAVTLPRALDADDVAALVAVHAGVADCCRQLVAQHRALTAKALPGVPPFPRLLGAVHGWTRHCRDALGAVILQLREIPAWVAADPNVLDFQFTLTPPDLGAVFLYKTPEGATAGKVGED